MTTERDPAWHEMPTALDALERAARTAPHTVAFTWVSDAGAATITYAELDARARAVAAALQERGATTGARVAVSMAPCLDFLAAFFGAIYAGAVAVPLQPPGKRTMDRVTSILADAQPAALLTSSESAPLLARKQPVTRWPDAICVDECHDARTWARPQSTIDDLALLQYTSGSTGRPRGVMITHANLCHNHTMIRDTFELTSASTIVGWLPPYHDMGLVGHIIEPIYSMIPTVLLPPQTFVTRPIAWLEAVTRYRGSVSGGPSSAYQMCVDRIADDDLARLDLRTWRIAFNGSETVRESTLTAFAEKFRRCGFDAGAFMPCYGLAEATLLVSARRRSRAAEASTSTAERRDVSCGELAPRLSCAIVDPETGERVPDGVIGEVWVAGPSQCAGYWNQPDASAALQGRVSGEATSYLRTGDLGYRRGDDLYIAGRLKDVIIVGGVNHYPDDIELTAQSTHGAVGGQAAAAFEVSTDDGARVVVVQETASAAALPPTIAADIAAEIADVHELAPLAVLIVRSGTLPRTPTGKIQRHLCRQRFLADAFEPIAQHRAAADSEPTEPVPCETETERALASICADVLSTPNISRDTNLLRLGGSSLAAARIANRISERFAIDLPMRVLFDAQTVQAIAAEIDRMRCAGTVPSPRLRIAVGPAGSR